MAAVIFLQDCWLNQESLLTEENIKIKVPFSSVTFTNTDNHFPRLFLPTWNILFALIVLFKWLAWQLCGDGGWWRAECVCVGSVWAVSPAELTVLGLNGDEFTPVTSHACEYIWTHTPAYTHTHTHTGTHCMMYRHNNKLVSFYLKCICGSIICIAAMTISNLSYMS